MILGLVRHWTKWHSISSGGIILLHTGHLMPAEKHNQNTLPYCINYKHFMINLHIIIRVEMKNPPGYYLPGYYPPGKTREIPGWAILQKWAILGNIIF